MMNNNTTLKSFFLDTKILQKRTTKKLFEALGLAEKVQRVSYWVALDKEMRPICDGFHCFRKGKEEEKKLVSLLGVKQRDGIYIFDDEEI